MESGKDKTIQNPNHELDLEFVRQIGGIPNNEESLHDKAFVTEEKANQCFEISSKLFLGSYMDKYKTTKK
jgi:hypothetical protein